MPLPQTPEQIPQHFEAAWNAKDVEALASIFAEDAHFVNVVGLWWRDRASIERAHRYGLTTFFAQSTLSARRVTVRMVGEDVAIVHTRWKLTGQTDTLGAPAENRFSVMSFTAERGAAGWSVLSAQNTDVVPGMETFIAKDGALHAADYRDTTGDPA